MNPGDNSGNNHELILHLELIMDEEEATRKSNMTLVGKFISEKTIKKNIVQLITRRIWFIQEPVNVDYIGENTFIFSFRKESDRARGLDQTALDDKRSTPSAQGMDSIDVDEQLRFFLLHFLDTNTWITIIVYDHSKCIKNWRLIQRCATGGTPLMEKCNGVEIHEDPSGDRHHKTFTNRFFPENRK